jgi:sortase A
MTSNAKNVKCAASDATCETRSTRWTPIRIAELALLVIGLICAVIFAAAHIESYLASHEAIEQFEASTQEESLTRVAPVQASANQTDATTAPDFSDWSQGRMRAYAGAAQQSNGIAVALLEVPRLQLTAPVFDGTDQLTLNHGLGLIAGTAWPGGLGNVGIAGHRDGFFRKLKSIRLGDEIDLATRGGPNVDVAVYVADKIQIVTPRDVSVLASDSEPSLTLITCYPFYSIGAAPKRFVVKAHLKHHDPAVSRLNPQTFNPSLEEQ